SRPLSAPDGRAARRTPRSPPGCAPRRRRPPRGPGRRRGRGGGAGPWPGGRPRSPPRWRPGRRRARRRRPPGPSSGPAAPRGPGPRCPRRAHRWHPARRRTGRRAIRARRVPRAPPGWGRCGPGRRWCASPARSARPSRPAADAPPGAADGGPTRALRRGAGPTRRAPRRPGGRARPRRRRRLGAAGGASAPWRDPPTVAGCGRPMVAPGGSRFGPMRAAVDTGGTFTDVITEDGGAAKVPSTPDDPGAAVRAGVAATVASRPALLAHGTTVATNALLEGTGAPVALVTTEGLADVVEIARQDRPSLYDAAVTRPDPLVPRHRRLEVTGRLGADGRELVPLGPVPEVPPDVAAVAV